MRKHQIDQLNNAYWLAHRLLGSKARKVYGSAYDIPEAIGPVDISIFGSVLLHLRDPFRALQSALELTKETVIVQEHIQGIASPLGGPYLRLLPDARTGGPRETWWAIPPEFVVQSIGVLGFEDAQVSYHTQNFRGRELPCYTVVGTRTHGKALGL